MKNDKIDIESLKRKNIHQVPDGYFDELPLKIQTRINEQKSHSGITFIPEMRVVWRLTAVAAILLLGWIFYQPNLGTAPSAEQLVADIGTEDLIQYLNEEDLSMEDILATVDHNYLLDEMSDIESDLIHNDLSQEELESIYSELDFSTEIL